MREILKEKGYKATRARTAVLEIFSKAAVPLNAEMISREISKMKDLKAINEATVYRTLSSLHKGGILRQVDLRKDSVFFELTEKHHHHIVCTRCNRIEDFVSEEIEKILKKVGSGSSNFKNIREHSLELFGLCVKCLPA